jgi:hemolysin activation/secretion protein
MAAEQLQSIGFGARYNYNATVSSRFDYGHQLQTVPGRSLGDFAAVSLCVSY